MRLFILLTMLVSCLSGCLRARKAEASLSDVYAERVISISKPKLGAQTQAVEVRVSGKIDGTARLELLLEGKAIVQKEITGKFDTLIQSDWYEDVIYIKYIPSKVSHGIINFQCKFIDAKKHPNQAAQRTPGLRPSVSDLKR